LLMLAHYQDRTWQTFQIYTAYCCCGSYNGHNHDDDEYETWRERMELAMLEFSQLYTKYNLPVDIRPCIV